MGEQSKGSPTAADLRQSALELRSRGNIGVRERAAVSFLPAMALVMADEMLAGADAMERAERLEAALRGFMALVNNGLGPRIDGPKEHMEAWDAAKAALAQEGGS